MFPVVLKGGLDRKYVEKWKKQFVKPGRARSEGIWRRTQEKETKAKSGWKSNKDARRRMIHFLDEYDVVKGEDDKFNFVIKGGYLWLSVSLPKEEVENYNKQVLDALAKNNWEKTVENKYSKDDIDLEISKHTIHPEDVKAGRELPKNYITYEYAILANNIDLRDRIIDSPWRILSTGIRKQGNRTDHPNIIKDLKQIAQYVPFQIEIGGGASIELGIPPLNHLHTTYNVTNKQDGSFVFGDDDFLPNFIKDPVGFYKRAGIAYLTSLLAEPNEFYLLIKDLYKENLAVGDIITNNFDGLSSLIGIQEKYVRRYDEPKQYPKIDFHSEAKSLLVVGNHADRREVEKQARMNNMKVIFVDPEMYVDYFGNTISYPLESMTDNDLLIQQNAADFAKEVRKAFNELGLLNSK